MSTPGITTAFTEAVAAGLGGGLVTATLGLFAGWRVSRRRQSKVHARLEVLEVQIAKDQKFRRLVVESQLTQIDLQQIIIDRLLVTCEDCPSAAPKAQDERVQSIIDSSRDGLRKYLGGIA